MWWWHWAASRARPPTGLPSAPAATAGENLNRSGSATEAAQACLALYAEGVQCEGDDVVLAGEHRHLDELFLIVFAVGSHFAYKEELNQS
jgi:hypothetical protein